MKVFLANNVALHWREDGDPDGQPVVFSNSLGTDLRLWDSVLAALPTGFRYIRYDTRGHGLSDCPEAPYAMDDLVADAEALIDHLKTGPVIFVGLSIGGMTGQGLAAKRPDLIKALVLSNTAAKLGTPEMWQTRMAEIRKGGIESLADAILDRWFGAEFRDDPSVSVWRAMLERTPREGYLGGCAAIAAADLTSTTAALKLPVVGIAGSEDGASPPELVEATCALIDGADCMTIDGAGHLPCVETPEVFAAILAGFLEEHADV